MEMTFDYNGKQYMHIAWAAIGKDLEPNVDEEMLKRIFNDYDTEKLAKLAKRYGQIKPYPMDLESSECEPVQDGAYLVVTFEDVMGDEVICIYKEYNADDADFCTKLNIYQGEQRISIEIPIEAARLMAKHQMNAPCSIFKVNGVDNHLPIGIEIEDEDDFGIVCL